MTQWQLTKSFETSAGMVRAGQSGQGPPLVLAHGWPWSSYSWHRVIPSLAKNHRVYWFDMPGYGQSQKWAGQPTSLGDQGMVFSEMLSFWGLERPAVIAHDFGGAVSLRAHLLHGCEFDRLVLMNVVAMRPWGSDFFAHVGRHAEAFAGLPDHIHRAVVQAYIEGALIAGLQGDDLQKLIEPWLSRDGSVSFYQQFALADEKYTAEIEPSFGNIRCPVKILWGADDPWIPIARGQELARLVGQGDVHPLDGVGHLPQLEAPTKVLNSLDDFL